MSTFRAERRWSRTGRERWRIDTPVLVFLVMTAAVFATCFAIGRATSAGSASAEASSRLGAAPVIAAIPVRLTAAPPVSLEEPAPPKPKHSSTHRAAPPASGFSASSPEASEGAPAQPVESRPAPTPEPAPTRSAPAPSSGKSSPSRGGSSGGHSKPSSGGSSFESSG